MISVNKINEKTKNTFFKRFYSSIFIFLYLLIYFVLALLADRNYNWTPLINNLYIQQGIAIVLLIWLLPLICIGSYEMNKVIFDNNKITLIILTIVFNICIYTTTISYFIYQYEFLNIKYLLTINYHYVIKLFGACLGCSYFVTLVILFFFLAFLKKINFKNCLYTILIFRFLRVFFLGLLYFTFIRSWITSLLLMMIVFLSDTFAYVGGVLFGKTKLAPKISPNKTVEGLIFGLVIATIVIMLIIFGLSYLPIKPKNGIVLKSQNVLYNIFGLDFSSSNEKNLTLHKQALWWICTIVAFLFLSLISTIGDLVFSAIKRNYHTKDYSNLIPGHGGLLDRIDSHSFVISIMFIFTLLITGSLQDENLFPNIQKFFIQLIV
ncbi:phosphatidate cytidylyltransferase [Ureaplasma parvum]|nr:phosphatidate cytidylyltransferase [Ureaplasma parvum]